MPKKTSNRSAVKAAFATKVTNRPVNTRLSAKEKAKAVLGVTEILEDILLNLSDREILLSQRVCYAFRTTIKESPQIRRRLFLEPHLPESWDSYDNRSIELQGTNADDEDSQHLTVRINHFLPYLTTDKKGLKGISTAVIETQHARWIINGYNYCPNNHGGVKPLQVDLAEIDRTNLGRVKQQLSLRTPLHLDSLIFKMYLCQPAVTVIVMIARWGTNCLSLEGSAGKPLGEHFKDIDMEVVLSEAEENGVEGVS